MPTDPPFNELPALEVANSSVDRSSLMTPDEVATALRVPLSWVYAHQRKLPGLVRLGRYVRFRRAAVEKFLHEKSACQ
jgi:excisionase family DNA binding protein